MNCGGCCVRAAICSALSTATASSTRNSTTRTGRRSNATGSLRSTPESAGILFEPSPRLLGCLPDARSGARDLQRGFSSFSATPRNEGRSRTGYAGPAEVGRRCLTDGVQ
jgi:hypothetical protein